MKKFICIAMAAAFLLSGCSVGTDKAQTSAVQEENDEVKGTTAPGSYNMSDFALYTLDEENYPSNVVAVLAVKPETVEYDDEKAKQASEAVTMESGSVKILNDKNEIEEQTLIKYFSYSGSRIPLTNVKGIKTTGLYIDDSDEDCSKVDAVMEAYEIDEEEEEFKTNENEDGSYTIDLYFSAADSDGNVERIVNPKGTDLSKVTAAYGMRFFIRNGYVHGIDCYMM